MRLLLKIFKASVSKGQILAFSVVNIVGVLIVILSVHVYFQIESTFESGKSNNLGSDYVVISKPVTGMTSFSSALLQFKKNQNSFSESDIKALEAINGVEKLAAFKTATFDVYGGVDLMGTALSTAMFLESLPTEFIDVDFSNIDWSADLDTKVLPVIVPKMYLDLYNYGFATANGYAQLTEGLVGLVKADMTIYGNGMRTGYKCRIVAFSDRINSILIPEEFLDAANERYGEYTETRPSRLILKVAPAAYADVYAQIQNLGFVPETRTDFQAKMSSTLKYILIAVGVIGAIFSILAFILLLISILLMIEKNKENNRILSSQGYPIRKIALPFQLIALSCDFLSVLVAVFSAYSILPVVNKIFASIQEDVIPIGKLPICLSAMAILVILCILHYFIILRSVKKTQL